MITKHVHFVKETRGANVSLDLRGSFVDEPTALHEIRAMASAGYREAPANPMVEGAEKRKVVYATTLALRKLADEAPELSKQTRVILADQADALDTLVQVQAVLMVQTSQEK